MRIVGFLCLFTIFSSILGLAQSNPVPFISQPLVPASAKPGSQQFTLMVNGAYFASGAVVNWNRSPVLTVVNSNRSLQATIPASDVSQVGTASVTVVNPGPGGGPSNVVYFPIRDSAPVIGFARIDHQTPKIGVTAIGDFNEDGNLDVAIGVRDTAFNGSIRIYFGNGKGGFQEPTKIPSAIPVDLLLAGDFNGDGHLDLAAVSSRGPDEGVSVFMGNGNGTFTEKPHSQNRFFGHIEALAAADFNGDGNLDLFVSAQDTSILLGNGDGSFTFSGFHGSPARGIPAIGDFNGDGKLDLAIADNGGVHVLLGRGDGTFGRPIIYHPKNGASFAITAADVNGDGKLDLITDGISVLLGNGDGTFEDAGGIPLTGQETNVVVGDFSGDGKLDAVAKGVVVLGNGDGTFRDPFTLQLPSSNEFETLGVGDFKSEGKLDLLYSGQASNGPVISLFLQNSAVLTPANLSFADQKVGTSSKPQKAFFFNVGASKLNIENIAIDGADAGDFAQSNDCSPTLPAGTKCTIKVTFTPTVAGERSASLSVSYQGLGSPESVSLSGIGLNAVIVSLTPSTMTFATQLIDTVSSPQTATLTNTGTEPVTIKKIIKRDRFGQKNNCPSTLQVGESCQIQVVFKPIAPGTATGKILVFDNAENSPQKVDLSGTGTVVKFSAVSVNFGDQKVGTTSSPVPIQLFNLGTTTLSISQIGITGVNAGDFNQTNSCGSSVPAGGNCTINVTFTPTALGQRNGALSVTDDGGGSPQTVPLTGTGT
jgi:hypothetical protein